MTQSAKRPLLLRTLPAILGGLCAALLPLAEASAQSASTYPSRPVRIVAAFAPGTTSDIIGRLVAERLTQSLGQPFMVENRTGAGGTIASEWVARSAPDGYTLLMSTAAMPISANLYPDLKFDTAKDFAAITLISTSPLALAAGPSLPAKTVAELIAYARPIPGKVAFGSAGVGTSHHLTGEKFAAEAGLTLNHVPYKGSPPAHVDLLGGQIHMMFDNVVSLMPHFKSGKLRPMAVTSARRNRMLPDVPTLQEAGLKDFEAVAWFGVVGPAALPPEIIGRLNAAILAVLAIPEVRERLLDGGSEIVGSTPEAAERHMRSEIAKWGAVIRAAGVKLN